MDISGDINRAMAEAIPALADSLSVAVQEALRRVIVDERERCAKLIEDTAMVVAGGPTPYQVDEYRRVIAQKIRLGL